MTVTVYTFKNEDESESGYNTQSASDAKEHAARYGLLCIDDVDHEAIADDLRILDMALREFGWRLAP